MAPTTANPREPKDIADFEAILAVSTGYSEAIIELECFDWLEKTKTDVVKKAIQPEASYFDIKINRPFLNSKNKYKDEKIFIRIYSNTKLNFRIKSGGQGWYSVIKDATFKSYKEARRNYLVIFLSLSLLQLLTITHYLLVFSNTQMKADDISVIVVQFFLVLMYWGMYYSIRKELF